MGEIVRMIIVLSLICGLSGFTLASVRDATRERIEEQVLTFVQGPALEQVFPAHDNSPVKDRKKFALPGQDAEIMVFPAMKDGKLNGVAFEVFAKGFGGDIGVMVGFSMQDEALSGIGITTMKETPGIGSRVAEPDYTDQFRGHPVDKIALRSGGGNIDAVSGATVSSTGTVTAIQKALEIFNGMKDQFKEAWG